MNGRHRTLTVDKEIGLAFGKEERLWKERGKESLVLIPLNLDGHLFEWAHPRSTEIRERNAADFTAWKGDVAFKKTLERLIQALRRQGGKTEKDS